MSSGVCLVTGQNTASKLLLVLLVKPTVKSVRVNDGKQGHYPILRGSEGSSGWTINCIMLFYIVNHSYLSFFVLSIKPIGNIHFLTLIPGYQRETFK